MGLPGTHEGRDQLEVSLRIIAHHSRGTRFAASQSNEGGGTQQFHRPRGSQEFLDSVPSVSSSKRQMRDGTFRYLGQPAILTRQIRAAVTSHQGRSLDREWRASQKTTTGHSAEITVNEFS